MSLEHTIATGGRVVRDYDDEMLTEISERLDRIEDHIGRLREESAEIYEAVLSLSSRIDKVNDDISLSCKSLVSSLRVSGIVFAIALCFLVYQTV